MNSNGNPIPGAYFHVIDLEKSMLVTSRGEYWRPLVPGKSYRVTVTAEGYKTPAPVTIKVPKDWPPKAVVKNWFLDRLDENNKP